MLTVLPSYIQKGILSHSSMNLKVMKDSILSPYFLFKESKETN